MGLSISIRHVNHVVVLELWGRLSVQERTLLHFAVSFRVHLPQTRVPVSVTSFLSSARVLPKPSAANATAMAKVARIIFESSLADLAGT